MFVFLLMPYDSSGAILLGVVTLQAEILGQIIL
jgi:hypothetical protein